jgi:hypothetical protein
MANVSFPLAKIPQDTHQDERLMQVLAGYHPIHVDDTRFSEKLTWCLEHCQNKFRDINTARGRTWYFENEQDATLFAMRWT